MIVCNLIFVLAFIWVVWALLGAIPPVRKQRESRRAEEERVHAETTQRAERQRAAAERQRTRELERLRSEAKAEALAEVRAKAERQQRAMEHAAKERITALREQKSVADSEFAAAAARAISNNPALTERARRWMSSQEVPKAALARMRADGFIDIFVAEHPSPLVRDRAGHMRALNRIDFTEALRLYED